MNGKKRIRAVCVILAAVFIVAGIFYYYYQTNQTQAKSEGTLIMQSGIGQLWQ